MLICMCYIHWLYIYIYIYIYIYSLVVEELKWLDGWVLERSSITAVSYNTHIYRMAEISIVNIRTLLVVLVFTIKVVTQSCQTLCDPMDYSLPSSSVHRIFPGESTGVGCHFLLQRIFLIQGLNPGFPHCRQTLYCLSYQKNSCVHNGGLQKSPYRISHAKCVWTFPSSW